MLVIEQFRNPELAKLQTAQNYTDVLQYFTGLIQCLIRRGVLAEDDPQIMAAQLCLPISAWINLCDREPECEAELMALADRHIRQFFRVYQRQAPELYGNDDLRKEQEDEQGAGRDRPSE